MIASEKTSNFPVGCSGVRWWDWNPMKIDGLGHAQSTEPVKWASTMVPSVTIQYLEIGYTVFITKNNQAISKILWVFGGLKF
jgi:hypothetical protein